MDALNSSLISKILFFNFDKFFNNSSDNTTPFFDINKLFNINNLIKQGWG